MGRARLTGRGGAGFPTARKLAAVAAGHAPVVVANGTEGEPACLKDRVLMARSPHLVLDGAVLAAELTGAGRAVIVVHRDVREIMDEAAAERARAGLDRVRLEVRTAAAGSWPARPARWCAGSSRGCCGDGSIRSTAVAAAPTRTAPCGWCALRCGRSAPS